ncbi:MAG: hypothetical protein ABJA78_07545 [Ferruginibacter sp.]
MRKIILAAFCFCIASFANAQKFEISTQLYGGLFSFNGNSQGVSNTTIVYDNSSYGLGVYSAKPYGKTPGTSIGVGAQFTFVTKSNVLFAFNTGYDNLGSTTNINEVREEGVILNIYPATGKTKHRSQYINIIPQIGYRINAGEIKVDLMAGFNIAQCLDTKEKLNAKTQTRTYTAENKTTHPKTDPRPELGFTVHYKKFGFISSYQWGVKNYYGLYIGGTKPEAFTRFLKLGLSYRIF